MSPEDQNIGAGSPRGTPLDDEAPPDIPELADEGDSAPGDAGFGEVEAHSGARRLSPPPKPRARRSDASALRPPEKPARASGAPAASTDEASPGETARRSDAAPPDLAAAPGSPAAATGARAAPHPSVNPAAPTAASPAAPRNPPVAAPRPASVAGSVAPPRPGATAQRPGRSDPPTVRTGAPVIPRLRSDPPPTAVTYPIGTPLPPVATDADASAPPSLRAMRIISVGEYVPTAFMDGAPAVRGANPAPSPVAAPAAPAPAPSPAAPPAAPVPSAKGPAAPIAVPRPASAPEPGSAAAVPRPAVPSARPLPASPPPVPAPEVAASRPETTAVAASAEGEAAPSPAAPRASSEPAPSPAAPRASSEPAAAPRVPAATAEGTTVAGAPSSTAPETPVRERGPDTETSRPPGAPLFAVEGVEDDRVAPPVIPGPPPPPSAIATRGHPGLEAATGHDPSSDAGAAVLNGSAAARPAPPRAPSVPRPARPRAEADPLDDAAPPPLEELDLDDEPPTARAALGGPATPVPPSVTEVGAPKPPPPPRRPPPLPRELREEPEKKPLRRPWWEELFLEDFGRAEFRLTDEQVRREADFIEESLGVARGGVILDLCCGAGRYSVELAQRGYGVVGFDLSLYQLALAQDVAQERGQKINFLQGDIREMTFEETFDGVLCWNTSFGYFEEEKNYSVVQRIFKALRPGGALLLDVANRDFVTRNTPTQVWYEGDGCVCMDDSSVDFITSRLRVKRSIIFDDGRQKECYYTIRLYSMHELGKLLHDVGFRVTEASGDLRTPSVFLGPYSPRLIMLAQRP